MKVLLERAATQSRLAEEAERLQRQLLYQGVLVDLVGTCPAMQQVFSLIRQVAPSRAAVLVTGESGTGKELVARAVHHLSPRRDGPFVAINCAALPETLMESELFGHEKGAFTGAVERRAGCFELAQHGTLLLDELAEMPVGTQAKLLRVLEDSCVRRLGGKSRDRRGCARDRFHQQSAGRGAAQRRVARGFVLPVERVPDHRCRRCASARAILPLLTETLIEMLNRKHETRVVDVNAEVREQLRRYSWPGNVRELRNVLERAVILAGEGTITKHHLPRDFGVPAGSASAAAGSGAGRRAAAGRHHGGRGREGAHPIDAAAYPQQQDASRRNPRHQPEDSVQQAQGVRRRRGGGRHGRVDVFEGTAAAARSWRWSRWSWS